jgi:hypothetical protein
VFKIMRKDEKLQTHLAPLLPLLALGDSALRILLRLAALARSANLTNNPLPQAVVSAPSGRAFLRPPARLVNRSSRNPARLGNNLLNLGLGRPMRIKADLAPIVVVVCSGPLKLVSHSVRSLREHLERPPLVAGLVPLQEVLEPLVNNSNRNKVYSASPPNLSSLLDLVHSVKIVRPFCSMP